MNRWYGGYAWSGGVEPVFNPYSINTLFSEEPWSAVDSPKWHSEFIRISFGHALKTLDNYTPTEEFSSSSFNFTNLIFQSGYLSVADEVSHLNKRSFKLKFPNTAASRGFLDILNYPIEVYSDECLSNKLGTALENRNIKEVVECLRVYYTSIPDTIHRLPIDHFGLNVYYSAILTVVLKSCNQIISAIPDPPVVGSRDVDFAVETESKIYLFRVITAGIKNSTAQLHPVEEELVLEEGERQIKEDRKCVDSFKSKGKSLIGLVLCLNGKERKIIKYKDFDM